MATSMTNVESTDTPNSKPTVGPLPVLDVAHAVAPWPQSEKQSDAPAPPPVWTRYIDSRLKQFCTR